jgi:hypothetical protein
VLIGLGVFFVGVAALARFYAYPTLAVAPADQIAHTVSAGKDATIFSVADLKEKNHVELEARRTVRGDVVAAEKISKALNRKVVVFDTAVVTDDSKNYQFPDDASLTGLLPLSFVQERVVLDARTGEAVRWNPSGGDDSGEYIATTLEKADRLKPDPKSPLFKGHEGLVLKFPFGTEKKTYQFWDSTLRKAFPIQFKRVTDIKGLKVYVFEQEIPKQEVPQAKPLEVPGSLVDQPGRDSVVVQRTYKNTRTLWVEPVTGAIIKGQEQQLATIAYDGEDKLTATPGHDRVRRRDPDEEREGRDRERRRRRRLPVEGRATAPDRLLDPAAGADPRTPVVRGGRRPAAAQRPEPTEAD